MGDIASARPVSGQPVASAWGVEVHDQLEGIQAGAAGVTFVNSSASGIAIVTFPRPYTAPPIVVASLAGGGGNAWALAYSITATSVTVQARSTATVASGTFTVDWIAVGTPA